MKNTEMIEEMAKEIARILFEDCLLNIGGSCADCEWNGKDTKEYDCQSLLVAKKLLEKYQPKLPEGSVVLSNDNAEELANLIVTSPQMQSVMSDLIKAWKKETAREICFKIIKDLPQPLQEKWKEFFAKEYGVEIK